MKNKKFELSLFSFYDITGMTRHLEQMAQKGWMIDKISNFGWHYRKTEPQKLRFTVSYFPHGSPFDPEPSQEQLSFQDFCVHSGWKLAASLGQLQIFYNEDMDAVPIETDPNMEIEMIKKQAKRVLWAEYMYLAFGIFMGVSFVASVFNNPLDVLSNPASIFSGLCWLMIFIYMSADLIKYYSWLKKAKKAAENGEFAETKSGSRKVIIGVLIVFILGFAYFLTAARQPYLRLITLLMLAAMVFSLFVSMTVTKLLKKKKVAAKTNLKATVFTSFIVSFILLNTITWIAVGQSMAGSDNAPYSEPPVRIETLLGTEQNSGYICGYYSSASIFVTEENYSQRRDFSVKTDLPSLYTTVWDIHMPFLYDFCLKSAFDNRDIGEDGEYIKADFEHNGVDLYCLTDGFEIQNVYLLCRKGRIVKLSGDFEMTNDMLITAADALFE